jgi:hypothetical protein
MTMTASEPQHADTSAPVAEPASSLLGFAERGLLPDAVIRIGIRRMLADRLRAEAARRQRSGPGTADRTLVDRPRPGTDGGALR